MSVENYNAFDVTFYMFLLLYIYFFLVMSL